MLNPARANSWTVASWSEPLGIPSLSFISALNYLEETRALAGVADVAVTETFHLHEHRVVVAVGEHFDDLQLVARRFAFHPQRVARAAEEGREAGLLREGQCFLVHESHHQHFGALGVLNDRRDQPVQL